MKSTILFLSLALIGASGRADSGGMYVEPMLTYGHDTAKLKTSTIPGFSDTSGTIDSYGVGAKLGAHVSDIVFLGIDGRWSRASLKDSSYGSANGNLYNIGLTGGVQMPMLVGLRVFGTWVPWGEFDPGGGSQGFDVKAKKAKGFRVGAGFRVAMVSLNLEYEQLKYGETDIQSIGSYTPSSGATNFNYKTNGWIASVSFPIDL